MEPSVVHPLIPAPGRALAVHCRALQALCTPEADSPRGRPRLPPVPLGLPPIDDALPSGGLNRWGVHEWLTEGSWAPGQARTCWLPPLTILLHLARCAAEAAPGRSLLWIGEAVHSYPPVLAGTGDLLGRSLFVRAGKTGERLWAADLAIRSGAPAAVLLDGSGLDLSATRRLQLAAEAGGVLCLLARPPWEAAELSAATTRWSVAVAPPGPASVRADEAIPARRWIVRLLRCKGVQPSAAAPRCWLVEQPHGTETGLVAADVRDGSVTPAAEARAWRHTA